MIDLYNKMDLRRCDGYRCGNVAFRWTALDGRHMPIQNTALRRVVLKGLVCCQHRDYDTSRAEIKTAKTLASEYERLRHRLSHRLQIL